MNQIKKKLQSNAGASIILAMTLLLICVMVSSVIVAAAASGASRNNENELRKQQEYLAITSAAQYIADNLNPSGNNTFCGVQLRQENPCNKYKSYDRMNVQVDGTYVSAYAIPTPYSSPEGAELNTVEVLRFYLCENTENTEETFCNTQLKKDALVEGNATAFAGIFGEMMQEAATAIYTWDETNVAHSRDFSKEFTMSVEDEEHIRDNRIPEVKCTFKMDAEYQVKILVESNVEESEASEYFLIVEMPAFSPSEDPSGWKTTKSCKHQCFYEYLDAEGNTQFSTEKEYTFTHEVNHSTTTVTWGTPTISKGGIDHD